MLGIKACAPITRLWIANFLGTSYLPLVEGRTENRKDEDCTKSQGPFVAVSETLKSQTLLLSFQSQEPVLWKSIQALETQSTLCKMWWLMLVITALRRNTGATLSCLEFMVNLSYRRPDFFLPSTNIRLLYYYITKTTVLRVNVRLDHWLAEILKNCQT